MPVVEEVLDRDLEALPVIGVHVALVFEVGETVDEHGLDVVLGEDPQVLAPPVGRRHDDPVDAARNELEDVPPLDLDVVVARGADDHRVLPLAEEGADLVEGLRVERVVEVVEYDPDGAGLAAVSPRRSGSPSGS